MVKLSACIECIFCEYDFNDRPAAAEAAGLKAIEFWGWANKDIPVVADALKSTGLKLAACGVASRDEKKTAAISEFGILDIRNVPIFTEIVQESIEAVAPLGVKTIITTTGQELIGVDRKCQHDAIIEALAASAPILEKAGFTLVLEPLNILVDHKGYYLDSSHEAADILKAVNSPNVKMLFDIYHQQITEGNLIANILEYLPLIGHFHTAGNPGRHELDNGEINYGPIFKAIDDAGYEGYVGLEYSPTVHSGLSLTGAFNASRA